MPFIMHFIIVTMYLNPRLLKYWKLKEVITRYVWPSEISDLAKNQPIRNIGFNQSEDTAIEVRVETSVNRWLCRSMKVDADLMLMLILKNWGFPVVKLVDHSGTGTGRLAVSAVAIVTMHALRVDIL